MKKASAVHSWTAEALTCQKGLLFTYKCYVLEKTDSRSFTSSGIFYATLYMLVVPFKVFLGNGAFSEKFPMSMFPV